ncbi:hypothetical protein ACOSQ3_011111 [Xanthoceras sorbifolium]
MVIILIHPIMMGFRCHPPLTVLSIFSDECSGGMDNTDNRPVGAGIGGYLVGASADWPPAAVPPQYNPAVDGVQSWWVLPGTDQYSIQPTHVGPSTSVDLPLFKGPIFESKEKNEVRVG